MIYNVLSSAQYNEAEAQGLINSNELYLLTDDENIFIAKYGVTTWDEVDSIYRDGTKPIVAYYYNTIIPFSGTDTDGNFIFRELHGATINEIKLDDTDNWSWSGSTTLAELNSPTFNGTPKAPTATVGTNTTQIATTEFVQSAVSSSDTLIATVTFTGTQYAESYSCDATYDSLYSALSSGRDVILKYKDSSNNNLYNFFFLEGFNPAYSGDALYFSRVTDNGNVHRFSVTNTDYWTYSIYETASKDSPTLTGTPKAPTATAGTKTTQIATTAFVNTAITNANNIFIATYGTTTYANISAAESAGKILFATRTNSGVTRCLPLIEKNAGGQYVFSGEYSGTNVYYTVNSSSNWGETTYALAAYSHSHTTYVTKAYAAGNASNYEVRYAKFLADNSTNSSAVPDATNKIIWFYE